MYLQLSLYYLILNLFINFSVQYRNKVNAIPAKTVSLDINNGYNNKNELSAEDLLHQLDLDVYGSTPPRTRYLNASLFHYFYFYRSFLYFFIIVIVCLIICGCFVDETALTFLLTFLFTFCMVFDDDLYWLNDFANFFLCKFSELK